MNITVGEIIIWLIVGALAGSLTGLVVKRKKEGYGRYTNLGVGLIGALIGGAIFNVFHIDLGLGQLSISFEDLLAAFLGSLLFLSVIWLVKKWRARSGKSGSA